MIKWYYLKSHWAEEDLVNVTITQNGTKTRVSFVKEQFDKITKDRIVFGIDGKRMYFTESAEGYKPNKSSTRKSFASAPALKEFTGHHPLFYDPELKLYYISSDNLE